MNYEILISISLGDNFPLHDEFLSKECKTTAILEAKFNDEILQSDPIELTTSNPELATELGFRLHKKDFQQFRTERKSIKLQCFVDYSTLPDRHFIGYVVLHLRDAQDYTNEPRYKWNVLLNPKYKGSATKRPQLYLALMVNKFTDTDNDSDNLDNSNQMTESHFTRPLKKDPKSMTSSYIDSMTNSMDFDSNIKVKFQDRFFYVWDENSSAQSDCTQTFVINVIIDQPNNLHNLLGETDSSWDSRSTFYFKFTLLGQHTKTSAFSDLESCGDFVKHKSKFVIKTVDKATLQRYFDSYPTIEIQFLSLYITEKLIGFVTLNILRLFNKANSCLDGEYMIVPEDESVYVKEPLPVVSLSIHVSDNENEDPKSKLKLRNSKPLKKRNSIDQDLSTMNHYYIAIDLRTIKLSTQETKILFQPFYLQFSYAFFGITDYIKTYPSINFVPEEPENAITIPHGFCGFNFATTVDKLQYTFANIPLIVQLILEKENTLLGTAKIDLSCLLKNGSSENFLNTTATVHDELNDEICEIQIVMFLQEIQNSANNQEIQLKLKELYASTSDDKRASELLDNLNGMIINTTQDIELWKDNQRKLFESKMKLKESELLATTNESLENKRRELKEMERKLHISMDNVNEKERIVMEKESMLLVKQKQLDEKFSKLSEEIDDAIHNVRTHYNDKTERYIDRIKALEQEKGKFNEKLYQLERKLKEKDLKIKDLENQLIDLNQLHKHKTQQQRATSLTRSVTNSNPRRIVITRDSPEPMSRSMIEKSPSASLRITKPPPARTISASTKPTAPRSIPSYRGDSPLLDKIKKERQELIKRGVSLNDPMVVEIDKQLRSIRLQNIKKL